MSLKDDPVNILTFIFEKGTNFLLLISQLIFF